MRNLFRKAPAYLTVPGQARPAADDAPSDGLWVRCENERCRELLYAREFEHNLKVCHKCQHHARLSARERIAQIVDQGSFIERDAELAPTDPLDFDALGASYRQKLAEAASKSGESEAAVAGSACLDGQPIQLAVLDPSSPKIQLYHRGQFQPYAPESGDLPIVQSSVDWYRGWRDH